MSINRARTTTLQGAHAKPFGKSPISSLSLLPKSINEEIQPFGNYVDNDNMQFILKIIELLVHFKE